MIRPNTSSITAQNAITPDDDEPVVGKKPGRVTKPSVVDGPAAPTIVVVVEPVVVVVGLMVVVVDPATVVVVDPATVVVVVGAAATVKSKPVAVEFVMVISRCQ